MSQYSILGEVVSATIDLSSVAPVTDGESTLRIDVGDARTTSAGVCAELDPHGDFPNDRVGPVQTPQGYRVAFRDVLDAHIHMSERRIDCRVWPTADHATVAHRLVNHVIPMYIIGQGGLVIHASAVLRDGQAIAFVGESGQGKSTLAANLAAAGWPALADDTNRIKADDGRVCIHAHHRGFRLLEGSVESLGLEPKAGEDSGEKALYTVGSAAEVGVAYPLRAVFILGEPTADVTIFPLQPADVFGELMHGTFSLDLRDREFVTRRFHQVNQLSLDVPIFALRYPRRMSVFAEVQSSIDRHLG